MVILLLALACTIPVDTQQTVDTETVTDTDEPVDSGDTGGDTGADTGDTGEIVETPYSDCVGVELSDGDADGTPELQTTTWHDAWGHEVRIERDEGVDGSVDAVDVHLWEADLWKGSTWDVDGDGELDLSYRREHDAQDHLVLEATDNGADGSDDNLTEYAWDGDLEVMRRTDFNGDGAWETVEERTYTDGLLTGWTLDVGDDGEVDQSRTWTHDAGGHVLVDELDSNADGTVDARYTYVWDGDLLVEERYDSNADGVVDRSFSHTYDEQGRQVRTELDKDGDGVTDEIGVKEWDGDDLIALRVDSDADGTWDYVLEQDFEDGMLVALREDVDGDGTWDTVETYGWDEEGRPLLKEVDAGGDGVVDKRTTWEWDC